MIIVVDFDGVLLDDYRFKRDYIRIFKKFGVSPQIYWRAYRLSKEKVGRYVPVCHLASLKKMYPSLNIRGLKKEIVRFTKYSDKYLYKDAKPFLTFLKKSRFTLILLSTGDQFQRKKILGSGLKRFFHKIQLVKSDYKASALAKLLKGRKQSVIFVDDKKETVDNVKKSFPQYFVMQLIRRRDQPRSELADVVVKNLGQARRIILNVEI